MEYKLKAKIWLYDGHAAWHFITLPKDISAEINELFGSDRPGWGAVPVKVSIKTASWETSIFPDKKSGGYLLPLKSEIRKKTGLKAGDNAELTIKIIA